MWVTRTQSIVCAVFALHTGRLVAVDTGVYIGTNIFDADEGGAIDVGTVCRIGCSKLLCFEVKIFDISLWKHGTTDLKRYWNLAAFGRKDRNVIESHGEMIEDAVWAITMRHGLTLESQSVFGRCLVETRLTRSEMLFLVWFCVAAVSFFIVIAGLTRLELRLRSDFICVYLCVELLRTCPLLIGSKGAII